MSFLDIAGSVSVASAAESGGPFSADTIVNFSGMQTSNPVNSDTPTTSSTASSAATTGQGAASSAAQSSDGAPIADTTGTAAGSGASSIFLIGGLLLVIGVGGFLIFRHFHKK